MTDKVQGHIIKDHGSSITQRPEIDFQGSGVVVSNSGSKTVVTIPGAAATNVAPFPIEAEVRTLSAPVNVGDAQITINAPFSSAYIGGRVMVNPGRQNGYMRYISSYSGNNVILTPQRSYPLSNGFPYPKIKASTKKIYWGRNITNIQLINNNTQVQIDYDEAAQFKEIDYATQTYKDAAIFIFGTTNWNRRYQYSPSGITYANGNTRMILDWDASILGTPATETAGGIVNFNAGHIASHFTVGEKFVLSGCTNAANNGTYTVASVDTGVGGTFITVVESFAGGDETFNSNTLFTWNINQAGSINDQVVLLPENTILTNAHYGSTGLPAEDAGQFTQRALFDGGSKTQVSVNGYVGRPQLIPDGSRSSWTFRYSQVSSFPLVDDFSPLVCGIAADGTRSYGTWIFDYCFSASGGLGAGVYFKTKPGTHMRHLRIDGAGTAGGENLVLEGEGCDMINIELLQGKWGLTLQNMNNYKAYDLDIEQNGNAILTYPMTSNKGFAAFGGHMESVLANYIDGYGYLEGEIIGIYSHAAPIVLRKGGSVKISMQNQLGTSGAAWIYGNGNDPLTNQITLNWGQDVHRSTGINVRQIPSSVGDGGPYTNPMGEFMLGPNGQIESWGPTEPQIPLRRMMQPATNPGDFLRLDNETTTGIARITNTGQFIGQGLQIGTSRAPGQLYDAISSGQFTVNFGASVTAGTSASTTSANDLTIVGASAGDTCSVAPLVDQPGIFFFARGIGAHKVRVTAFNTTGSTWNGSSVGLVVDLLNRNVTQQTQPANFVTKNVGLATTDGGSNGVGTVAWTNPTNVTSGTYPTGDGTFATAALNNNVVSHYLLATMQGNQFAIAGTPTIQGVLVDVFANKTGTAIMDNSVKLIKGGVLVGNNKATSAYWPTNSLRVPWGGFGDLWGTTLTVTDVNASNFGVAISARNYNDGASHQAAIDSIWMTIFYT